ncbi:MAG: amidase [Ectothiorhodospiraceae bacterium]|nr:amidase [Chromatiales bacterium]MCP5157615.1 amidase [Ectothiorhodospiraceae bacterium]
MTDANLCSRSASELRRMLGRGELGSRELTAACLAQIERLEPAVNAFVTVAGERALEAATAADRRAAQGGELPPLHGLPLAVKDLVRTAGLRTTFGSLLYADHVPAVDDLLASRYREAGAIIIGKTNTPEFGCGGGQTTNAVAGTTRNPYDLERACGSSSGGSAAALAARMVPLADGSDFGGSLRHPAGHCNVVGFRPSPGRVPTYPNQLGWFTLSVAGPMGRCVEDVALLLSAQAGPDPRSPIALPEPGARFREPLPRDFQGVRIAFSRNLGFLPVEPRVAAVFEQQRAVLESLGMEVVDADPDIADALEVFKVLRAWRYTVAHGDRVRDPAQRARMKSDLVWNTEEGFKLTGEAVARAEARRTELYHRMREFMARFEFLALPTNPTPPLPIDQSTVAEIDGARMRDYVDGSALKSAISTVGNPAVSVPAGFTAEGWPVGIQLVGRHQADFALLQLAYAFEQATRVAERPPAIAAG